VPWLAILSSLLKLARWASEQAHRRQLMADGANKHLAETIDEWTRNIKKARGVRDSVEYITDRERLRGDPDARSD
jgi:hypothetical protein